MPYFDNKPYPVLIIAAFVTLGVVVMLWALYGTNGPTSMDATKKASQTTSSSASPASDENKNR
jgi:hypothetical protein